MRQLCEFFLVTQKDLFWAFLDLGKTFDRVDRDALWQVLRVYGVDRNLLKAVQSFYVDVRIGNEVSEYFSVNVGVR